MHAIQQAILDLAEKKNLAKMSLRDIGKAATGQEQYPQKIKYHIDQLVAAGYLRIDERRELIERVSSGTNRSGIISLAIVGAANCGPAATLAEERVEGYLQLSKSIVGKDPSGYFIVRAIGNSMNKAKVDGLSIEDGDFVIINGNDHTPRNGDYVLSVIDGLANVKRFFRDAKSGQISLLSESSEETTPIFINPDDHLPYFVAGKVKHVLKKPTMTWA